MGDGGDGYELERFVAAQAAGPDFLAELRAGRKVTHWMWFVFPQIAGLGFSPTSRRYAIRSLEEARAYLSHPLLGPRLRECVRILSTHPADAEAIFDVVDSKKLRSSLTLFARAAPDERLFIEQLDRFFDGHADPATDARI